MKTLLALLSLTALAAASPMKRVTNREYPDGSGSSKETDPEKRQAVETFFGPTRKVTHKVIYQLDERLQPLSAIFYDPKNIVYQKSTFKLDGEDRIIQEVNYDAKDRLIGTRNFTYGTRNGSATVINVDSYDSNGNLIQSPRQGSSRRR